MKQEEIYIGAMLRIVPQPVLDEELERHFDTVVRDSIYYKLIGMAGKDFTVRGICPEGDRGDMGGYYYLSEERVECISPGISLKIYSWALEPRDQDELLSDPEDLFAFLSST